jgi:hypothetical protein
LSDKIKIDGVEYDWPEVESLTLDEAVILYDHSGLTLDQIPDLKGTFHPGFIKGMLHIAVVRVRPDVPRREIEERLGKLKLGEMDEVFESMGDEDESPEEGSAPKSGESSLSSGKSGTAASESSPALVTPEDFGAPGSGIGLGSDRATLAT